MKAKRTTKRKIEFDVKDGYIQGLIGKPPMKNASDKWTSGWTKGRATRVYHLTSLHEKKTEGLSQDQD